MKCLYIIGNIKKDVCKIGISKNPDKRLKQLQTGCPYRLSILAIVNGMGYESEKELHKRCSDLRINGEWFRIGKEIESIIKQSKPINNIPKDNVKVIPPISDEEYWKMTKKRKRRKRNSKHIKGVYNHR